MSGHDIKMCQPLGGDEARTDASQEKGRGSAATFEAFPSPEGFDGPPGVWLGFIGLGMSRDSLGAVGSSLTSGRDGGFLPHPPGWPPREARRPRS